MTLIRIGYALLKQCRAPAGRRQIDAPVTA
jgi:hypothetical protein